MKRALLIVVVAFGALALAGCSNNGLTPTGASINAIEVTMADGRVVPCVVVGSVSVSCDWEAAR